ncbi:DNA methyltransferase [Methanoregula sp. UBA64]|jgi:site-specific DNA-methyltransferase (cytosine-N4-specific)|uniref:DNA methyltransferase n=1 Tax=Methanoregula sp. UBA64 TaxID=1915554 RepID=UPI0025ED5309|nr:DNA methyltransferase [Methanoregula sp. UBA64]
MSEPIKYIDTNWDFRTDDTKISNHGFHTYPAMMIPQIARRLIEMYGKNAKVLFDPFVGSGTSILEAKLHDNFEIAYGIDINPLARLIAKVKATPIHQAILVEETENLIQKCISDKEAASFGGFTVEKPTFRNIDFWFKADVIIDLTIIKNNIEGISTENKELQQDIIDFCKVAFSEVVRLCSNTRNSEFKLYRMSEKSLSKHNPNTISEFSKKLRSNVKKFEEFNQKAKKCKVVLLNEDTRERTSIPDHCVDIIVSSPPYGDSHTTVAYGQFSRLSLEFLGYEEKSVRRLDKVSLGGIPSKTAIPNLGSESLSDTITTIKEKDIKRVQEVLSFYEDFNRCVIEIDRVMRKGGYICFVVGNRTVKGIKIPTDEIIVELFRSQNKYKHHKTIIRNIPNKRMPSKNSPTNVVGKLESTMNEEYIVILEKMS